MIAIKMAIVLSEPKLEGTHHLTIGPDGFEI